MNSGCVVCYIEAIGMLITFLLCPTMFGLSSEYAQTAVSMGMNHSFVEADITRLSVLLKTHIPVSMSQLGFSQIGCNALLYTGTFLKFRELQDIPHLLALDEDILLRCMELIRDANQICSCYIYNVLPKFINTHHELSFSYNRLVPV